MPATKGAKIYVKVVGRDIQGTETSQSLQVNSPQLNYTQHIFGIKTKKKQKNQSVLEVPIQRYN